MNPYNKTKIEDYLLDAVRNIRKAKECVGPTGKDAIADHNRRYELRRLSEAENIILISIQQFKRLL